MDAWVAQYVGVPFAKMGRDPGRGWDCWGLVRHVEQVHYGKALPSFADDYDGETFTEAEEIARLIDQRVPLVNARRVPMPDPGDVVLMAYRGEPCHVGVYVGEGKVLHVLPHCGTVVDRLAGIRNNRRVEGFYRV